MDAYCVLDGGGVKAACFAGALHAAENHDVTFLGYGGASGGALISVLAAAGYTGSDIRQELPGLQLESILDDGGEKIGSLQHRADKISRIYKLGGLLKWLKIGRQAWLSRRDVIPALDSLGLYSSDVVGIRLLDLVNKKLNSEYREISFSDFEKVTGKKLRIVASDIHNHSPALFGGKSKDFGDSVIAAASASSCFPGVFSPPDINGHRLLDGGISSNLPTFFFKEEASEANVPILAFDLVQDRQTQNASSHYGPVQTASDILSTALNAGDVLLREASTRVKHIPVAVPPAISTFTLSLSDDQVNRAFESGYTSASEYLANMPEIRISKQAGAEQIRQLQSKYASVELVEPVLWGMASHIEAISAAEDVRLSVMVPTGAGSRRVIYHCGMQDSPDLDMELPMEAGCSGRAFSTGQAALADLQDASKSWGMNPLQVNKIPKDRKSMLAVPVKAWLGGPGRLAAEAEGAPVIATLAADSSTQLEDTGWMQGGEARAAIVEPMLRWSEIVAKLIS